jgi:TRAP-type C4-dicarboxylate transport system permease small subunit
MTTVRRFQPGTPTRNKTIMAPLPRLAADPDTAVGRFLDRLCGLVATLGGVALVVVMVVSSLSVVMRAIPGLRSIPGDTEIVQIGCALAVFAFLPLCQLRRSNVFVDFFTAGLPQRLRSILDLAANLLFLAITLLITIQLGHGTADKFATRDSTMVLRIPESWPYAVALALCVLLVIVTAYTAIRSAIEIGRGRAIGPQPTGDH